MIRKIISLHQTKLILARDYFRFPFQVTGSNLFLRVSLNDNLGLPLGYDMLMDFNVYDKHLFIDYLYIDSELRGSGMAKLLLEPLFSFYLDYDLQKISLILENESFWNHIKTKYSWVKFNFIL